jgi:hypothetical protein
MEHCTEFKWTLLPVLSPHIDIFLALPPLSNSLALGGFLYMKSDTNSSFYDNYKTWSPHDVEPARPSTAMFDSITGGAIFFDGPSMPNEPFTRYLLCVDMYLQTFVFLRTHVFGVCYV